jgi:hypothetical protein
MKKNNLKLGYKLKILNDGSSIYIWTFPWIGLAPFTKEDKDTSVHPIWNINKENEIIQIKTGHLELYTKKIKAVGKHNLLNNNEKTN